MSVARLSAAELEKRLAGIKLLSLDADAIPAARDAACYVTDRNGGDGAVREVCDLIVAAKAGA